MCGIAGLIAMRSQSSISTIASDMADRLTHRGPDDRGVWFDNDAGVAFAQRRLSIVDLSPAGHQPMASHCGRYILTYNGEIYNHPELRAELEREGVIQWRGHSDTEVLLAAIVRLGLSKALERCIGMFAIALWDRLEQTLSLARDRIGEKPLYYGWVGTSFVFASELKAFRSFPGWNPSIDRGSLALLMRHNYIPAPYSIYNGVSKLRPGHILTLKQGCQETSVDTYWRASAAAEHGRENSFAGSPDEAVVELERLIRRALGGQMIADVPLGAFLSGGVDSSAIAALMQTMSSRPIRTFTIGFEQASYDEAVYAKEVARHLGTNHTEMYVSDREALEVVPTLPYVYCEPFSDSSQIPTLLVSRLARQTVTVALSGDGGDELFSGYTRYVLADEVWAKLSLLPRPLRRTVATLAKMPSAAVYDRFAQPFLQMLPNSRRPRRIGEKVRKTADLLGLQTLDDVYRRLCSHWQTPEQIVVGATEWPTMLTGYEELPKFGGNVQRMMFTDLVSYLPDDILVKVDRAAMAMGLETRVPLLDHRVVEFAMSLPLPLLRSEGVSKRPLREILYKYVPKRMVDRPKMGFGVPLGEWLRGPLRDWAEALLTDRQLAEDGYFSAAPIRAAWQDHLSGRRDNQYMLWNVLMFQAWRIAQTDDAHIGA